MWRVRNSNPARRENHLHNRYVLPNARGGSDPQRQTEAVTTKRHRASDVGRQRMATEDEMVAAGDVKFGPIYDTALPSLVPTPVRPTKTPAEEYFETKAPPTPRRLKADESSTIKNLELTPIWQQIISYKKLPYNVNKSALFHEISQRLIDPEWQVRQHGLKVLQDVIPIVKSEELDSFMMSCVLPEVVLNLTHSAPAVKSSAFDALLIYIKYSSDPEYVLRVIVFQTLEASNVPSNLQICAMNCLPALLAQVLAHGKFNDGSFQSQTISFDDYSGDNAFKFNDSGDANRATQGRNKTPGIRSTDRARTPVNTASQVSQQSLLHLITVLGKKMVQITFQHCAVACLEKIKHLVGANFFDRLCEGYKPNLKRDFDTLCQVYEVPNSNISDVIISPMDSLISSDGKEADGFLSDDENDRQDDTDRISSTSSFVSSSDENTRASNQNSSQNKLESRPGSRNDQIKNQGPSYDKTSEISTNKTLHMHNQDGRATSMEESVTSQSSIESPDKNSNEDGKSQAQSMSETDCINNGKILVETEIKLSEDTAIQMMVLQEKDEKKPEIKDFEEDDEIKQLKRVTFGGELIKLRTPDSDNQNTDDDLKRRNYDSVQIYHGDDRENGKYVSEPIRIENENINDVTQRFVKLDTNETPSTSKSLKTTKVQPHEEEKRGNQSLEQRTQNFDDPKNRLQSGASSNLTASKREDMEQNIVIQKNNSSPEYSQRNIGTPEVRSVRSGDTARLTGNDRNSPVISQGSSRQSDSARGVRVKAPRKTENRTIKKTRRPRSSHIPIPIKPALHRPKYRRYIFSANNRRSSSKSQTSSSGATYDVRDSPIPNLEGGESLTSSSESEARYRHSGQRVGSNDFLPKISLIPATVLADLNNKDDWRQRIRGLDQLTHSLRQPDVVRFLGVSDPQKTGSATLLKLLIGILNERETPLRVLNSCLKALRSLCLALPVQNLVSQLPHLVPATCQYLGGATNISVKLEAVETIKMLLRKLRPSSVVNTLFAEQCFFSKSSKMRESSLLCLLYALMIFPSTEFNIPALINVLLKFGCSEPKRKVRQALLDTYAVLGQFAPFPVSSIHETDGKDVKLFKKAVQVRLTRRQLPTVTPEGLISYALQVNSSSKGADVEWVQAGSGTVSGGSAEAQSQISMAPFLLSDQQQPLASGIWGESINEIMVTGIPPVSLHARDAPTLNYYPDEFKAMQDGNYNNNYEFTYQTYEFPQIKTIKNTSGKTSELFGKNTGAPSRGIKTWPPVQSNSKLPSSPTRAVSVDLPSHQSAHPYHHRDFSSNSSNSNFPAIVNARSPDWKVPSWAENTFYYPKVSNVSKWGRQEYIFNAEQYLRHEERSRDDWALTMKFRDSVKSTGSDIKLNSEDRVNNNFAEELKRPGAIVQGDPYIRDADDKWYNPKGCLDQLCLIFRCPCINKSNQVQPDEIHNRGGVQHSPINRNNFYPMANGVTHRGMGNAPGQKSGSKVIQVNPADNKDSDKYGLEKRDKDHTTSKFGGNAYGFDSPAENKTTTKYGGNAYGFDQSDERKKTSTYPSDGNYKNGNDRVYKIPVEVDSKDGKSIGAKIGIGGRSLLSDPKIEADSTTGNEAWSKSTHVKHAFSDLNNPDRSHQSKSYGGGTNEGNRNVYGRDDGGAAAYGHQSDRSKADYGNYNWQSTNKNARVVDGYGTQNKVYGNGESSYNHSSNPENPFGSQSYPHGTPHPKKHDRNADVSTKNRSNDKTQSQYHQKSYDNEFSPSKNGGDGQSRPPKFSESNKAKSFESGAANHGDRQYQGHKKNSDHNKTKGFESRALNNGDRQNQAHHKSDWKTAGFEAREKNSKDSSENPRTFVDNYRKMDDDSKSKHTLAGDKRDKRVHDNRQKTSVIGRDGRKKSPVRCLSNERLPDDERKKVVREARQFRSDSLESLDTTGTHQNTWTSTAANYDSSEERDERFSRIDESRLVGRESLSADSTRRRRDVRNRVNFQNGDPTKLTNGASRTFKSDPNFNDEFMDHRSSDRIDPLGDAVQIANQPGVNKFSNSTSFHGRMTHATSGHQNDFAPLPSRIMNVPEDEVDFATNSNSVKSPVRMVSNAKSYENLAQKNGYGDRVKYASPQHRKQQEVKSSKGSSLYPNTLQPFDSPKDALEKCLLQIESPEWEIVMQSLQGIVRLTRYHPEYLVSALHRIVAGLSKQIRSLRSQVTKAACVVSQELFEQLGKTMDPEIEELAPALLSRTCDANKFLQHDANSALDSMIDNVSAARSATFLLSKGAKHRSAVVRTTACRLLARLCRNLGVNQVYSLPRDTRDSILNAAAKFLLEGSLETRAHAKELLSVLAQEPKFMRIMNDVVPSKTMEAVRKPLIKIINQK